MTNNAVDGSQKSVVDSKILKEMFQCTLLRNVMSVHVVVLCYANKNFPHNEYFADEKSPLVV